jgi:hypothetical protein
MIKTELKYFPTPSRVGLVIQSQSNWLKIECKIYSMSIRRSPKTFLEISGKIFIIGMKLRECQLGVAYGHLVSKLEKPALE